jgi:hypothetical protein
VIRDPVITGYGRSLQQCWNQTAVKMHCTSSFSIAITVKHQFRTNFLTFTRERDRNIIITDSLPYDQLLRAIPIISEVSSQKVHYRSQSPILTTCRSGMVSKEMSTRRLFQSAVRDKTNELSNNTSLIEDYGWNWNRGKITNSHDFLN